jgi:hypothetical protein
MKDSQKQTKKVGRSRIDFGKMQERFDHVAKDVEGMEFEESLKEHEAEFAASKPIQNLEKLTQDDINDIAEGDRSYKAHERREATRKFIKDVMSISDPESDLCQVGLVLLRLLDQIEQGNTSVRREFSTTSVDFVRLCRAECEKAAETDFQQSKIGFLSELMPEESSE